MRWGAAEGVVLIEDGDDVAGGGAGGEEAGASDGDLEASGKARRDTVGGEDAGGGRQVRRWGNSSAPGSGVSPVRVSGLGRRRSRRAA